MDFLPHAEPTLELQECVQKVDLNLFSDLSLVKLLTAIKTLVSWKESINVHLLSVMAAKDFKDGGAFYQNQLNRIARCIRGKANGGHEPIKYHLQESHDVSEILAQIENEKAAELALKQTNETSEYSLVLDTPHIFHPGFHNGEAASGTVESAKMVRQPYKGRGRKRAVSCDAWVEAPLRQNQGS